MSKYKFCDCSHHEGEVDMQALADAGHRLIIIKASDGYHMPDINGKYDFAAERHYDARFVSNFVNARETGLLAAAYHFVRFDRPLPVSDRENIIAKNLEYFQIAIAMLPEQYQEQKTVVLDMEQASYQLKAAGLDKATVSDMAVKIVDLFLAAYENVIFYAGSWWTDEWLTTAASEYIASKTTCWEPEYIGVNSDGNPTNPDYAPSVPKGFFNEFATQADDVIGKLFAWQFASSGFMGLDTNITEMPKEQLYILFNQDGAVDPPGNGGYQDIDDELIAIREAAVYIVDTVDLIFEGGEEPPTEPPVEPPAEPPVEPPVEPPPTTDFYLHLKYIYDKNLPNAKDFTPAFRLVRASNGKYKADKIGGDAVVLGEVVKLLGTPVQGTYENEDGVEAKGWWLLADGHDIPKNMQLAAHLEGGIPDDVDKSKLMYIEAFLNDKYQKCLVIFDATQNIWRNPDTHEDWTP